MLVLSTVAQSLALQSPDAWPVARKLGYQLHFAAAEDEWASELAPLGSFQTLPATRSLHPLSLFRLATRLRTLSKAPWDLVQVQTPIVSAVWRLVASREVRRKTIYVAHGLHFYKGGPQISGGIFRFIEFSLASRAGAIATVCSEDDAWVRNLPSRMAPSLSWRLPGAGVPIDRFRNAQALRSGDLYALFVGELNANKDPMLAIEAVELARATCTELELVIIGRGPLEPAVTEAATSRPWVTHLCVSREVERWMAGAAVLLAPSKREGLPRVIIEALAVGLPVLARANRGSSELLGGGLGTLIDRESPPSVWAERITQALKRPQNSDAMRERAAEYDSSAFSTSFHELMRAMEARTGAQKQ